MKRALILSGGGQFGAFQVGVLKHLMGDKGLQYDTYLGVSVGAINAAYLAMFKPEQKGQAIAGLEGLWSKIDTKSVYKRWCPFGKLHGLWKNALFNSKPLQEMIYRTLDQKKILASGNTLRVGAVSLKSGDYRMFGEDYPRLADAVLGSAAFPGMLLPVELEGELYTDGGVRDVTPLGNVIGLGADEVDVILCSTESMDQIQANPGNTLEVALRSVSIMSDETAQNDVRIALLINELVKVGARPDKKYVKINVYRPEKILSESLLEFNPDEIQKMISHGYMVAKKAQ